MVERLTCNQQIRVRFSFEAQMNEKRNARKRFLYNRRKSKFCLHCGAKTTNKFCSQKCQHDFNASAIFKKIETTENFYCNSLSTTHRWLKRYLIQLHGEKCMECGWDKKHPLTNKVPIELEHIDGNSENNRLNNLKLLCPNCHSLTLTYKALNMGNGRYNRRERYKSGKSF